MPTELENLLAASLQTVRQDSLHNLGIIERYKIYEMLASIDELRPLRFTLGWLGVLVTRKILNKWESQANYWVGMEYQFGDDIDIKELPNLILATLEDVLKAKISLAEARDKLSNLYHVIVSSVGDELFEYNPQGPMEMACISDAAYNGLYQAVSGRSVVLKYLKSIEHLTDDDLPTEMLDGAGSAMLAYAGGNILGPVDVQKRLEFWEWWLTEAIPQAWQLAQETT